MAEGVGNGGDFTCGQLRPWHIYTWMGICSNSTENEVASFLFIILAIYIIGSSYGLKGSVGNILLNPGFETGDISSWTVGGKNGGFGVTNNGAVLPVTGAPDAPGLFYSSQQNVRSGNFAAYGITAGDSQAPFSEFVSFSQSVSLQAGTYELGFWLSTVDVNGGVGLNSATTSGRLGIYVDGTQIPFTISPSVDGTLTSSWVEFASRDTLGTGMHQIQFDISAGGTARVGISLDDTFMMAVPEPSCSALAALGLVPLVHTMRRHTPNRKG